MFALVGFSVPLLSPLIMPANRPWIFAFWFYFAILLTIIVSAYRGILPTEIDRIPHYDTLGHFILLGIAAYLGHKALGKRYIRLSKIGISLPVAATVITFVIFIEECFQLLSPVRTFSLIDMASNLIGICLFTWLAQVK